eukprot:6134683-Amphidinium_carterae.1
MRADALRSSREEGPPGHVQSAEALSSRTTTPGQAVNRLRRDAAERDVSRQESRSSSWGGPSPAEAG